MSDQAHKATPQSESKAVATDSPMPAYRYQDAGKGSFVVSYGANGAPATKSERERQQSTSLQNFRIDPSAV